MTKEQWVRILGIVLSALLAIAAVFGYDIGVIQPRETARVAAVQAEVGVLRAEMAAAVSGGGGAGFAGGGAGFAGGGFAGGGTGTLQPAGTTNYNSVELDGALIFRAEPSSTAETTITYAAPSDDNVIVFPDASGTVTLDGGEVCQAGAPLCAATGGVTGSLVVMQGGGLMWEGAVADDYETTLQVNGPSADRDIYLPDDSGLVGLFGGGARVAVWGRSVVTGTLSVSHGLNDVAGALCTVNTDPANGEESFCTAAVSGTTVTLKVWKEDIPAAGDSGVSVSWVVFGTNLGVQ